MLRGGRMENPKPLIMVGMSCLALGGVWPKIAQLAPGLGPDWVDGLRGLLYGVAFGTLLWAARLGGLRRRRGS